jgi:hypothetical protein
MEGMKWRFGGASKIEGHLEVLLELWFSPNLQNLE